MGKSRRRIVFWPAVAAALLTLALAGAVGASARDGRGSDDGARPAETRGHDQEREPARQADRSAQAAADDEGEGGPLLRSSLAPSVPTDPAIAGVAPGGLPWVLGRGSVLLQSGGRIRVVIKGLVIPVAHLGLPAGTARPVTSVSASLFCNAASTPVGTTGAVPISEAGDATIDDTITLPAACLAPIVLVHPNANVASYISATGWR